MHHFSQGIEFLSKPETHCLIEHVLSPGVSSLDATFPRGFDALILARCHRSQWLLSRHFCLIGSMLLVKNAGKTVLIFRFPVNKPISSLKRAAPPRLPLG